MHIARGRLRGISVILAVVILGVSGVVHADTPYTPAGLMGQPDFTTGNHASPTAQNFEGLSDTKLDAIHHRLFVADSGNSRILMYNLDADNNLLDATADAVLGQPDFVTGDPGNHPPATASNLDCGYYCGLAYDAARNLLFVSDRYYNRVVVYDVASITNGEAAIHVLGQPDFTTSSCPPSRTQKTICSPLSGLAYDADNQRLFVPQSLAKRVLIFDVSTITDNMDASYVLGQPDFTTAVTNSSPTANNLGIDWSGAIFDPDTQRFYVADASFNRVMVFDVTPGTVTNGKAAAYVLGQSDFTSGGQGTTDHSLNLPQGMAFDPIHKQLFVSEYTNCRVTVFDTASLANGESALAVLGMPDYTTVCNFDPPTAQNMGPDNVDMEVDPAHHRLYMPDSANARMLIFDLAHITSSILPGGTTHNAYNGSVTISGAQGSKNFSVTSGILPPGMALNAATGALTGTPAAIGTYNFTVKVIDDNGTNGSFWDSRSQTLVVTEGTDGSGSNGGSGEASTTSVPTSKPDPFTTQEDISSINGTPPFEGNAPDIAEQTTASPATPDAIVLNTLSGFLGEGASLTLRSGETVNLCTGGTTTCNGNDRHTITINKIDIASNSVELSFSPSGKTITLILQKPQTIDIDNDHSDDIRVRATAIAADSASITFQNIKKAALQNQANGNGHTSDASNWSIWAIGSLAAVVLLTVIYRLFRRRLS
jgi:hypothetical protein